MAKKTQTVATKTLILYGASTFHIIEAAKGNKILYQICISRSYIRDVYEDHIYRAVYQDHISEISIKIRDIKPLAKNASVCRPHGFESLNLSDHILNMF